MAKKFKIVPLELKELNMLVQRLHRHHKPVQGHRFSLGVLDEKGMLVGGCSAGRPVARLTNSKEVLEVTRLVTDGTYNACSFLYSAIARIAKEMGYKKAQTFILNTESGGSLKASGWVFESVSAGGQWRRSDGKPRRTDQPTCPKNKWIKNL